MHYEFFAFITNALEVNFYSVYCIGLQAVQCKLSFCDKLRYVLGSGICSNSQLH